MKDKNKILIISIIATLLVFIVGATFAYFLSRSEISNTLNIVTNIENNNGTFIAQGSNIELNITSSSMQQSVSNNVAAENNTLLNVEYLSGTNTEIICSYDINYEWVSDNETNPYTKLGDKEFTYEIKDGENEIIKEETNFVASSDRLKHKVATEYIANSSISTPTKKQYTVNAKFYNLGVDQNINSGKNWNIKFYVDNVVCGLQGETYSFDNDNTTYEYTKGISENLVFEVETPLSNFNPGGSVEVDNEVVSSSNYTATSGSTVITFNKSYVESLSEDEHNIKIKFNTGGYSETTFRVQPGIGNIVINKVSTSGINLETREDTCTYGESVTINAVDIPGYTSPSSQTFTCEKENNKTLTYTPIEYTITYTLNSGTATNPSTYTIETENFILNNPTRSYYNFIGWSGTDLTGNNNTSVTIEKGSTGNRSYTANFEANYYNVSYNANNGSGAPSAQNNITWNSNVTIPNTTPTRSGYDFLGWSTSSSATSASYTKGSSYNLSSLTSRGGTVTLYAVWKGTTKILVDGSYNNTALTGGWQISYVGNTNGGSAAAVGNGSVDSTGLHFTSGSPNTYDVFSTKNKINLDGVKYIKANFNCGGAWGRDQYANVRISISKNVGAGNYVTSGSSGFDNYYSMIGTSYDSAFVNSTSGTVTFDVSQYTGDWCIRPTFSYTNAATFTKVWLEY